VYTEVSVQVLTSFSLKEKRNWFYQLMQFFSNLRANFPRGSAAIYANSLQTYYVQAVDWHNNTSCTSATVRHVFLFRLLMSELRIRLDQTILSSRRFSLSLCVSSTGA